MRVTFSGAPAPYLSSRSLRPLAAQHHPYTANADGANTPQDRSFFDPESEIVSDGGESDENLR